MYRGLILILFLCLIGTFGCAESWDKLVSMQMAGTSLQGMERIYIKKQERDTRGIDLLIKSELIKKGYKAFTEEDGPKPNNVDGVLVYYDRWLLDLILGMFLFHLTVFIENPEEGKVLVAGKSITRFWTEQEIIIKNVLDLLLKDKP